VTVGVDVSVPIIVVRVWVAVWIRVKIVWVRIAVGGEVIERKRNFLESFSSD